MEVTSATEAYQPTAAEEPEKAEPQHWGYHLVLDCRACDIPAITNPKVLDTFLRTLVKEIDMKMYGEPVMAHFATHDPKASGYTLMQMIETSSITGHFVDLNGDAYIDVFSCKPFETATAVKVVNEFFHPQNIKLTMLYRQA